ncbi:MAG: hypothetical protein JJU28_07900 [Cyclobacteriaceae bacterium]|nr:hypothetical protein [Cyclobacteriaceae bacterium]
MKSYFTYPFILPLMVLSALFLSSCNNEEEEDPGPQDPCDNGLTASVTDFMHAYIGQNSGMVQIGASGGSGTVTYSMDGQNFVASGTFSNLAPGNYTFTVKDSNDCTATIGFEIMEFPVVSFAADVLPVINANCQISPCHGTNPSIPSWSGYNPVKANADNIRSMVTSRAMPPQEANITLTDNQIATIRNWIDVGAPDN